MNQPQTDDDSRIAIVDTLFNCDESDLPFGKRWGQESIRLTEAHLAALRAGQRLALDVQAEYVVYLELGTQAEIGPNMKELGHGK